MKDLFFARNSLYYALLIFFVFSLGFAYPVFVPIGKLFVIAFVFLIALDIAMLFIRRYPVKAERIVEDKLSNGDFNDGKIIVTSMFPFVANISVIEEFPYQLQIRNNLYNLGRLGPGLSKEISYRIKPVERGEYLFGDIRVMAKTRLKLFARRISIKSGKEVRVYPSFIQYRKYSFLAISNRLSEAGIKKVRQLGMGKEFEQIREYVQGDNFKTINWKATARRNEIMVNQYQEEKAQNIYCIIDKGRLMHMPFNQLSLLDYSINASLVMAGVAIGRGDKAGLLTFSDKIGSLVVAENRRSQMQKIVETLYNQDVRLKESDFLRLYNNVKIWIRKRSLLILFTNFDSLVTLKRQLSYLKALGSAHLLCVVIFENSEVNEWAENKAYGMENAYRQTLAEKFHHDKRLIAKELNKNGIYTILTEPESLTINTINRYLQMKAQALI